MILPLLLSSISAPKNITPAGLKQALQTSSSSSAYLFKPLEQVLSCCNALRGILIPHLHLVVPSLCKLMGQLQEVGMETVHWQILTIRTIRKICTTPRGYASISDESNVITSRLIHALIKTITICLEYDRHRGSPHGSSSPTSGSQYSIYAECIHTICSIGFQIGPKFLTFDSLVLRTIENKGIDTQEYLELSHMLHSGHLPEYDYCDREIFRDNGSAEDPESADKIGLNSSKLESDMVGIGSYYVSGPNPRAPSNDGSSSGQDGSEMHVFTNRKARGGHYSQSAMVTQKLPFNQQQLSRAWDTSQRTTGTSAVSTLAPLNFTLIFFQFPLSI